MSFSDFLNCPKPIDGRTPCTIIVPTKSLGMDSLNDPQARLANTFPSAQNTLKFDGNTAHSCYVGFTWDRAPDGPSANNPNNPADRHLIRYVPKPLLCFLHFMLSQQFLHCTGLRQSSRLCAKISRSHCLQMREYRCLRSWICQSLRSLHRCWQRCLSVHCLSSALCGFSHRRRVWQSFHRGSKIPHSIQQMGWQTFARYGSLRRTHNVEQSNFASLYFVVLFSFWLCVQKNKVHFAGFNVSSHIYEHNGRKRDTFFDYTPTPFTLLGLILKFFV